MKGVVVDKIQQKISDLDFLPLGVRNVLKAQSSPNKLPFLPSAVMRTLEQSDSVLAQPVYSPVVCVCLSFPTADITASCLEGQRWPQPSVPGGGSGGERERQQTKTGSGNERQEQDEDLCGGVGSLHNIVRYPRKSRTRLIMGVGSLTGTRKQGRDQLAGGSDRYSTHAAVSC